MRRLPASQSAIGKWIVVIVGVFIAGCTRLAFEYPEPVLLTGLPTGVDPDAAVFLSRMATVPYGDSTHVRGRAGACLYCTVNVRIRSMGRTQDIDPSNGPSGGAPVARIENLDPEHTEARFGLRPASQYVYFLWVDRKPSSTDARLTLVRVPTGGGRVTASHQKELHLCHPRPVGQTPTSDADFEEYRYSGPCTYRSAEISDHVIRASIIPGAPVLAYLSRLTVSLGRRFLIAGGGWIDCNAGCCT